MLLTVLLVSQLGAPATTTYAFKPHIHEAIVRAALADGNTLAGDALERVIRADRRSDFHQFAPERHFDSARNPREICERWSNGVGHFFDQAVAASAPTGPEKRILHDRSEALDALGRALHALEDFYSHTNWVELALEERGLQEPAPLLGQSCDPSTFPSGLQSGYFSLTHGPDGCPGTAFGGAPSPPSGFQYCHVQVNKDQPGEGHSDLVGPDGRTYHELARELATRTTRDAWEALHDRIVARYGPDPTIDAECLFTKLAWGGDRTCHRLWHLRGSYGFRDETRTSFLHVSRQAELRDLDIRLYSQGSPRHPGPHAPPDPTAVYGRWTSGDGSLHTIRVVPGKGSSDVQEPYRRVPSGDPPDVCHEAFAESPSVPEARITNIWNIWLEFVWQVRLDPTTGLASGLSADLLSRRLPGLEDIALEHFDPRYSSRRYKPGFALELRAGHQRVAHGGPFREGTGANEQWLDLDVEPDAGEPSIDVLTSCMHSVSPPLGPGAFTPEPDDTATTPVRSCLGVWIGYLDEYGSMDNVFCHEHR